MCLFSKQEPQGATGAPAGGADASTEQREEGEQAEDQNAKKKNKIKSLTWNPLRLAVLRLGLTEPAMTSPLNYGRNYNGTFDCAYCGAVLFDSGAKYDSGTGWPSFWRTARENAVAYRRDLTGLECQCQRCGSHLGHTFADGPRATSVEDAVALRERPASDPRLGGGDGAERLPRYCINGAALRYRERGDGASEQQSSPSDQQ